MAGNPRTDLKWIKHWDRPVPEIPSLAHFNEGAANPGFTLPPHVHTSFELCYIVSGRARWQNTDGVYDLGPGDLYFTLPGEVHGGVADSRDPHHNFSVVFDLRLPRARVGDPAQDAAEEARSVESIAPRLRAIPGGQSTERTWIAIRTELERLPPPQDPMRPLAVAMVQALLVELAVATTRLGIAALTMAPPSLPAAQLALVRERLRDHLSEPPALEEMAGWIGLSPGHFAVLFKRAYDRTPHEYLTELRIEAACERLRAQPERAVTDIALELGFCTSQYFAEVFRRHRGMSPSQWRAGHR